MGQISVKNIYKKYKKYSSKWSRLLEWMTINKCCRHEAFWALQDISFNIGTGESVGIIGLNGAGKSTLLKILTGTTMPTHGGVDLRGSIAALLELGMGFHPEFSGIENAKLALSMTGLDKEKIEELIPAIEKFSELGNYIFQPLRVYSTGMQMRLAFSVSTVMRPDILIVDEALSVGDAHFQHKCINRIRDFKKKGTTLLFVSHDPGAVKSLCDRAMLLDQGKLIKDGTPNTILDFYNGIIAKKSSDSAIKQVETELGKTSTRSGNKKAVIKKVDMLDQKGKSSRAFIVGDKAYINCEIEFNEEIEKPTVGIVIRDRLGNDIFGTNTYYLKCIKDLCKPGDKLLFSFCTNLNLGYGNYSLSVSLHSSHSHLDDNYDWWDHCSIFQVVPNDSYTFIGSSALPMQVEIKEI